MEIASPTGVLMPVGPAMSQQALPEDMHPKRHVDPDIKKDEQICHVKDKAVLPANEDLRLPAFR